ncbi:MAG: hypothetical protein G01um101430_274 [Parcubacteria group bacterium Gr01-1014_30]|nr:MAG: hypothetical protein G01um101430_274 [Parcubacteria group bacterium Gr01-1014_30]
MAKPHIITGLDIGSSSCKLMVAAFPKRGGDLEILGFSEEPSLGIRKGVVINPAEVSACARAALTKLGEKSGLDLDSAYINVGGAHMFAVPSRGLVSVSRADQKISQEDVDRVLLAAQTFPLPLNREVLEVFPREFIVDGEGGIKEPQGLSGVRLEVEVLALGGFSPYIKNLTSAVLGSGLQVDDLIFSPLAASRAVLSQREKELGVCLLDVGSGNTGLAIFEEGDLVHLNVFPFGSGNITSDIAIYLKSDIDLAERVKFEFGTAIFQGQDKREKVELDDEETLVFSKKQISKVIEDRVSEMFSEVNKELKRLGKQQLPSGIVLTGGGVKLPRIKEFAKKEFRLHCRLGKIKGFLSSPEDPQLATLCGLVLSGADLETDRIGWSKSSFSGKGIGGRLKKIFKIFVP